MVSCGMRALFAITVATIPAAVCGSAATEASRSAPIPPPSAGHALIYHAALESVLLVNAGLGGMSSPASDSRTVIWRWSGADWTVLDSLGPPIRNLGGVAYNAARNRLVMYGGGYDQNLVYDDTWEWSPQTKWIQKRAAGPGKRDHLQMVYDAARQRVVLYGGQANPTTFPADTWTWDGNEWERFAGTSPAGRVHHTMTYDPSGARVLMFGGSVGGNGDTWAWNGAAWSPAAPATTPRTHATLGLTSSGVILYGGMSPQLPVLKLEGAAWRADVEPNAPAPRYLSAMAFDAKRNVTVLFGGGEPASDRLYNDTWEYSVATGWVKRQ